MLYETPKNHGAIVAPKFKKVNSEKVLNLELSSEVGREVRSRVVGEGWIMRVSRPLKSIN